MPISETMNSLAISFPNSHLSILQIDLFFILGASLFLVVVGWAWRQVKPYHLPSPLPEWFKVWFLTVQIGGIGLPLVALLWLGVWQGYSHVRLVLLSYFLILGLQILSESVSLRQFRSVVFVMVPYLYIPYRIWQLWQGVVLLSTESELIWVQNLLYAEIILWVINYALDLSQLPRLLHWEIRMDEISESISKDELVAKSNISRFD